MTCYYLKQIKINFKEEIEWNEFSFKFVISLTIKCKKVNFQRGVSFISYSYWLRKKYVTINTKNNNERSFKHAVAFTQYQKEIKSKLQRVANIKSLIDQILSHLNYLLRQL